MANNSTRTPGSGEDIRTIDKSGPKTPVTLLDLGGTGTESLVTKNNGLPVAGAALSDPVRVQIDPTFFNGGPTNAGQILFEEPHPITGAFDMWNDGVPLNSGAGIDWNVCNFGKPTIRLSTQGQVLSGSPSSPGTSPQTTGIVFKKRMQFPVAGTFSIEMWLRWTSQNNGTNTMTCIDLYNRTDTTAHMSRLWIDATASPIPFSYLNSGGTYTQATTAQSSIATHMYDPPGGSMDISGMWTFVRLITDFTAGKYVGVQVNDTYTDLSAQSYYTFATSAAQALHFGISYGRKTSTRSYMNIGQVIGRRYA